MKYCTECGTKLESRPLEHEGIVPFCPQCGEYRFPMYNVAVSMIVVNEENGKLLLVKQYGKDFFRLVAGYVNLGESLEAAVVRELKEEMGMTAHRFHYNRTEYFPPSNKAGTLYMIAGCRFFCFWKQIWIWATLLWFIRDYSATTVNISEKPVVSSISITDSLTL